LGRIRSDYSELVIKGHMTLKLCLLAALLVTLSAALYTDIRERHEREQEAKRFIQQVEKQPSKNWGKSAKTIQNW
jgi:hypothetical protein